LILVNTGRPFLADDSKNGGLPMLGITLTIDQIRNAPPPVRQWIEKEIATALGVAAPQAAPAPAQPETHMAACSVEDAEAIFAQIQGVLPAVNVFFEFGRPTISYGEPPVMAFRLLDIMYHARLHDAGEVLAFLQMIDETLANVRHDPSARFCGFDNEGHCFIPAQTQASIAALWKKIAAGLKATEPAADKPLSSAA
jgi:hypothetical protein